MSMRYDIKEGDATNRIYTLVRFIKIEYSVIFIFYFFKTNF